MRQDVSKNAISSEEYKKIKTDEYYKARSLTDAILNSKDPLVMYKKARPITDLRNMLETSAEIFGNKPMLQQIDAKGQNILKISYQEAETLVRALGTELIRICGTNKHIGIIGPNCYQWAIAYFAVACSGNVCVPLDKELSEDDLANLSNEAELNTVICCAGKFSEKFLKLKSAGKIRIPNFIHTDIRAESCDGDSYNFDDLIKQGIDAIEQGDLTYVGTKILATDLASIVFTSGTTGVSKGVMLSHRNLTSDVMLAQAYLEVRPSDVFFSVLPIHHTYECSCTLLEASYMGASIVYGRGIKYIQKDMQMSHPTFLLAVPLIYEKFYNSITKELKKQHRFALVNFIFKLNKPFRSWRMNIGKLVARPILARFGGAIRMFIAGGASVRPEILEFFGSMGVKTLQGYGLTETSPMVALTPDQWHYMRNDSVGRLLQSTECKIIEPDEYGNGEICFRGPQVMQGYYANESATKEALIDGWFHTGDLGHIDKDGYIYITGRKKNLIIAANGKNVYPEELEEKLMQEDSVLECMVFAETLESGNSGIITAAIKPDDDIVIEALLSQGFKISKQDLSKYYLEANASSLSPEAQLIRNFLESSISAVNGELPDWKRIKRIVVKSNDFIKTTGLKIKRHIIENRKP